MTGNPASARLRRSLAALLLLAAGPGRAELEFTLEVDRGSVTASQPIQLTLRISDVSPLSDIASPTIDLREFIAHGPSVMNMESHDRKGALYTRELQYTLYARNPGRFVLGPARLRAAGEVLTTDQVEVHVRGKAPAGRTREAGGGAGERELEDDIFVRAEADRDTAYVGEQVNVRFDLCYRYRLRGPRLSEVPEYTGFWVKELHSASRLDPHREVIDGLPFQVAPLRHVALFPTASGHQVIEPLGLTCSLLEDPIFGRGRTLMFRSEPLSIVVRPLPERGRPRGFAGAVGEFDISAEASPRELRAGDPVTLRVSITGTGNVQSIPEPVLDPPGFEIYEPKVKVEEGRSADGRYMAARHLEYILIPEGGGRLEIPALSVTYFDPAVHRYRTASTAPIAIRSRGGGAGTEAGGGYDLTRREIERLGSDIRHIKPDVDRIGAAPALYQRLWYWLAHAVLPLGYVALVAWHRHRRRLEKDTGYARRRRSGGALSGRLREARRRASDGDGFHAALQEAVVTFIADQADLPAPGLTPDRCRTELEDRGLGTDLVDRVAAVLERCEFGRYSPAASDRAAREELLAEAEGVAALLRKALT